MRELPSLLLVFLIGCSGSTESSPHDSSPDASADATRSDSSEDAVFDDAITADSSLDVSDGSSLDATVNPTGCIRSAKLCGGAGECVVATHMVDCCGTLQVIGVTEAALADFDACETAWRASLSECECASQPTTDEQGEPVTDIANVSSQCTNFTSTGGICQSYQGT